MKVHHFKKTRMLKHFKRFRANFEENIHFFVVASVEGFSLLRIKKNKAKVEVIVSNDMLKLQFGGNSKLLAYFVTN